MDSIIQRMIRASRLDISLYEEVEADTEASMQAVIVVVLSSIATGVGSLVFSGIRGLFIFTVTALVGWYIWAYLTYLIGTKLMPEPQTQSNPGELLRTIGFASSPGVLRVFGIIPVLGGIINFVVYIWMLITMVIAVRQALDYQSTGRAIGVCIIGWIIYVILTAILGAMTGWSFQ
jgi:hypothetical protein